MNKNQPALRSLFDMSDLKNSDWFEETHENIALRFRLKDRLFSEQSDFQKVEIVETQEHGKLLAHDGMVMVTEKDEFIYQVFSYPD